MSVFGIILAIAVLLIAFVIMYDVVVKQEHPKDVLELFVKTDWPTRISELGIISDTFLKKIGLAIQG